MTVDAAVEYRPRDYSLTGPDAARATAAGLDDAEWYHSPVARDQMRALLERRDGPAIRDTLLWFGLLVVFGLAGILLWGSWWAAVPFFLYGVIYASSSDSRWHESSHGTAFKTDWMNNALYEIASFMVLREATPWRWSHTRHHSDTIIVGLDPEIAVPRPVKPLQVFMMFFNIQAARKYVTHVWLHARGKIAPDEATYIPESAYPGVFLRARLYILIYLCVLALALLTRSLLPLLFIGLPSFYGAWLMVTYGLTQHAGLAEDVLDHRLNTRTVYMNALNRYLYWNMGYHVEHHMFPLVPYHALPKLHARVKGDMPPPYDGLLAAYREIIPTLKRQVTDPTYFVHRPLPATDGATNDTNFTKGTADAGGGLSVASAVVPVAAEGWVVAGESAGLMQGDLRPFEQGGHSYVIYRTEDGLLHATDGMCTHGNARLADGLLQGQVIECPRHNGRFDVRDGSPQRLPACIALRTYAVREEGGVILLDITSGRNAAEVEPAHTFRVVSNDLVATYIKELVLAPDASAPDASAPDASAPDASAPDASAPDGSMPAYQPGDYLQFEIPPYPERSLADLDAPPPYAARWREEGVFDLRAANPAAVRRSYSMANDPAGATRLRFNVRLATPPRGLEAPAGMGSTYLFGLRPGDHMTAYGPYGAFHIRPTGREMVYLGGGSGMAPLRAHIERLFGAEPTARRVGYWYGARTQADLFYTDYFGALAQRHAQFTYHVALSEPRPEDAWQGPVGFIHDVLYRDYLAAHPDPTQIEYYLCGPLPMIRAAVAMLDDLGVPREQILSDEF